MKLIKQGGSQTIEFKTSFQKEVIEYAVAHDEFKNLKLKSNNQVVYDIKSVLDKSDGRL